MNEKNKGEVKEKKTHLIAKMPKGPKGKKSFI